MALLRLISRPNSDTTSLYYLLFLIFGLPGGSDGKESACNVGDTGDAGLNPGFKDLQEDLLEKGMAPHSSTLVWRIPWT